MWRQCWWVTILTLVAGNGDENGGSKNGENGMNRGRHDVYIAGFFPFGKGVENSKTGRGVMPSVKLALDHVNEHSGVLRNYRLHMWWNDTECNAAVGVKAFFDMMHSGPHKLMLFGAACTHVTDPIAKASKHWHLTQLSYADTHPMFTSDNFPNFFRIVPSENAFNSPRLSLLRKFNWTRVGTIYQNEPRYSLAHNRLVADLDTMNAEVAETASFANEVTTSLIKLKEKDVRIILGNFDEKWARKIFCEAHRLGMHGKKYQWIIMGTYSQEWWNFDNYDSQYGDEYANCSKAEIVQALEQTILTDLLPLSTTGEITVSGITADEYKFEYDSRRGGEYSRFHGYTYDGVWAVALAIQHVAHKIKLYRRNQTVSDFKYRDPLWERLFLEALGNTSFEGVTGPVRFYGNERKASILLKQFQDGAEIKVGEYNAATDHLDLTLGAPMKWLGRYPPKDRTVEIIEHTQVNKQIYLLFASLSIIGILMSIIFLIINIKYRNQRYIKMSSPQLNNLIIIGCMLTYTSVLFLGLDSTSGLFKIQTFPLICTARLTTLMIGFSLAFGAMFTKTWRVHSIFTDVKLNKKIISDYQLFIIVGLLLFIDFIIITTWQIIDPFYRQTKKLEPYPHPSSDDIIIIQENEYCQSERMTIFVVSIYIYKGLLMILGAFLAWETRHVSIPALNDSRHVGLSVYNVVIICICGAAVALVLADRRDAAFVIVAIFIIFCTTTTLCLVFIPKLVELRRNPGGSIDKRIRATLRPMSKTRRDSNVTELEYRLKEVKSYNSKYRKTLLEKESELQMLLRSLGNESADDILADPKDSMSAKSLAVPTKQPPQVRRDATSTTAEPSDTTSLCSISSIKHDTLGSRKSPKHDTPKLPSISQQSDQQKSECQQHMKNGSATSIATPTSTQSRRMSMRSTGESTGEMVCHRRVSVPTQQVRPTVTKNGEVKKKIDFSGHVVTKSELWDTPQHRCQHKKQPEVVMITNKDNELNYTKQMIHRSVSEKKQRLQSTPAPTPTTQTPPQQKTPPPNHTKQMQVTKFQSTPNVAAMTTLQRPKKQKNYNELNSACSESELLDGGSAVAVNQVGSGMHLSAGLGGGGGVANSAAILPIFQKLLTERKKSFNYGQSCPNISIKCDIVEYL